MSGSVSTEVRVILEFKSWWLSGTGGGRGRKQDVVCHRDKDGFPAMPMSEVKGTLRETAEMLAEEGCGWSKIDVALLFGSRKENGEGGPDGALRFGEDACVSERQKAELKGATDLLFERIAATRITCKGIAADHSLRATEAAVPTTIEGKITWDSPASPPDNWVALLDMAMAATPAFGKGKFDGFGRVTARVEERKPTPVAIPDVPEEHLRAKKVGMILVQTRSAIFSERAATEAPHRTKPPTGASLLGWCAQRGPYSNFNDPFAVFHSGAVKFGTPMPVLEDGRIGVPFPKNLFAPKDAKVRNDVKLDLKVVCIGAPKSEGDKNIQFEPLKHEFLVSDGTTLDLEHGQRLRTATEKGRVERSKLFGYQHLQTNGTKRFYVEIERVGDICDADWKRILESFHGITLSLGRGKRTGYGGQFKCSLVRPLEGDVNYPSAPLDRRVQVLAMSDIAPIDRNGMPTSHPSASDLGLPGNLEFLPEESFVSLSRHAPWNGTLGGRDLERLVIEAGSVLTYCLLDGETAESTGGGVRLVGDNTHIGFGRIWINPLFLSEEKLKEDYRLPTLSGHGSVFTDSTTPEGGGERSGGLSNWIVRRRNATKEVAR
ncbi:RAMP superfamily CRISPR-associated protein [uncultured Aliiroseovarius sp.]|uniref:RAMP superfamily CRISPR-associated protein n=1 Tax=uncultured Aliiroseovarius sp. TaxID=1658783 RepID=UPI00262CB803|nr:RAMP superfamily CRISPR-associated protein [uncultured Aliiroseovarius sp.]